MPNPPAADAEIRGTPMSATVQDTGKPELSLGFVLLHQFTLAAFAGLIDVLRLAADHGGCSRQIHARWRVMSTDGLPRTSSAGVTIEVGGGLPEDPAEFDYIAICGGNDYPNTYLPPSLGDWLRQASASRVRMLVTKELSLRNL